MTKIDPRYPLPKSVKIPARTTPMSGTYKLTKQQLKHIDNILKKESVYQLRRYMSDHGLKKGILKKYAVFLRLRDDQAHPLSTWTEYANAFQR